MKNETIKKIAFIEFIIIFILFGIIVFGIVIQGRKDKEYKINYNRLENTAKKLGNTIVELHENIYALENQQPEIIEIYKYDNENNLQLENTNNELGNTIERIDRDITEIEKLLSEFFDD